MMAAASDPPILFRRRRSHWALGMSLVLAKTFHALIQFPPSSKFVESEGGAIALFGGLERITGSIYVIFVRHVELMAGLFKVFQGLYDFFGHETHASTPIQSLHKTPRT
mgnify:CR=1 FL=1